jgi:ABC-type sugar transport system permease subunit
LSLGYAAAIAFTLLMAVVLVATIFISRMRRERR